MLLNCGVGEDSWESHGLQGDPTSPSSRRSVLVVHWRDWCWSWNSNTLTTWWEELTHLKRLWCWERFRAGGEGDDRGWDGWMASPTQWAWFWVDSRSWWWTGRPGVLRFMGSERGTRLRDWTELKKKKILQKDFGPQSKEILRQSLKIKSFKSFHLLFASLSFLLTVIPGCVNNRSH